MKIMNAFTIDFDNRTQRLVGIDIVKTIAIIFVVLTHTALPMPAYRLWAGLAVPSFLMIAAFGNARKATLSGIDGVRGWYTRSNFVKYFRRISLPYLFMCVAEVIALPLIGYTTPDLAFLNTIKGGMGPGGYYLFCFAQLFLLFPVLWRAYRRRPWLTICLVLGIQLAFGLLFSLVIVPKWEIAGSIYKFFCIRFLAVTMAGIVLFDRFSKVPWWGFLLFALAGFGLGLTIVLLPTAFAWDTAGVLYDLQLALYTFGVTGGLIVGTSWLRYRHKKNPLTIFADSTLHILLFQQIYFCCVGSRPKHILLDTCVALLGGFAYYLLWVCSAKGISMFASRKRQKIEQ